LTKAKPKTEKIKAVKETKPKKTEKAKIETKSKEKTQTKKEVKTKAKPKPKPKTTTTKTKKKVVEEKVHFSVMSHVLVPKHEIVSDSEISEIMNKYNIESKSQFPKILSEDPAVKEIK